MLTRILAPHRKLALSLVTLFILAIPVPHQVVPAWPMRLVDQQGNAQGGIPTTQTWRHWIYQSQPLSETRRSDAQGRVSFPERTAWGSGLRYVYGLVANITLYGTDAAFGSDVWVYARKDAANGGSNVYTSGQTPPDTLLVHRYGVCPAAGQQTAPVAPGLVRLPAAGER